jgi:hypothetical protein
VRDRLAGEEIDVVVILGPRLEVMEGHVDEQRRGQEGGAVQGCDGASEGVFLRRGQRVGVLDLENKSQNNLSS